MADAPTHHHERNRVGPQRCGRGRSEHDEGAQPEVVQVLRRAKLVTSRGHRGEQEAVTLQVGAVSQFASGCDALWGVGAGVRGVPHDDRHRGQDDPETEIPPSMSPKVQVGQTDTRPNQPRRRPIRKPVPQDMCVAIRTSGSRRRAAAESSQGATTAPATINVA